MMLWIAFACAIKDGSEVLRIQQSYREQVKEIPSEDLSFEQSMAKLYMQKSWEEYANAQYQDALRLALKSEEWLNKSIETSKKDALPEDEKNIPDTPSPPQQETPPNLPDSTEEKSKDNDSNGADQDLSQDGPK